MRRDEIGWDETNGNEMNDMTFRSHPSNLSLIQTSPNRGPRPEKRVRSLISDQTSFGQAFEIVVHERQLHIVKIALIPCNKRVEIVWSRRDRRRNGLDAFGAKDLLVVR